MMQRFCTILLALLLAGGALVYPAQVARAQPPDTELGESLGFVILFPELRNLPAPTWFRPGVRVSYNIISANFQGGGAGGGIVQYDAVGLAAGWAMASAQTYNDNGAGNLIPLGGPAPKIGLPAVGEYWIHPAVLVNAERVANQNLSVTRLNKSYLSQTVQVVRFQSTTQGGRTVWEFDAATGLLMFYSVEAGNSASQSTVAGFRTMNLPTQGVRAPNWVRPGVEMLFTGFQRQTIAGGVGNVDTPYAASLQIQLATPTWSLQTQRSFLNGIETGSAVATVSGVGQISGALWLPREALGRIGQGEVIVDQQDSITGAQLRVGRAQNGAIYVRELNQAYEMVYFYDPNLGSLDAITQQIASPTNIAYLEVTRTGGSNLAQLNSQPELINTLLQPGTTVLPDPAANQTVRVALPNSTLTLELPAGMVGEPFNLTVKVPSEIPVPPNDIPTLGSPFILQVRSNTTGGAILPFARAAGIALQLSTTRAADNTTPVLHVYDGTDWQPLQSSYNSTTGTVSASHNRPGLYAVFAVSAPVIDDPDDPPAANRLFLPALQRP
jgi:hypothetical protein